MRLTRWLASAAWKAGTMALGACKHGCCRLSSTRWTGWRLPRASSFWAPPTVWTLWTPPFSGQVALIGSCMSRCLTAATAGRSSSCTRGASQFRVTATSSSTHWLRRATGALVPSWKPPVGKLRLQRSGLAAMLSWPRTLRCSRLARTPEKGAALVSPAEQLGPTMARRFSRTWRVSAASFGRWTLTLSHRVSSTRQHAGRGDRRLMDLKKKEAANESVR
mmetsp:Transcript_15192/g.43097  ORF Transcript_15192/g.43097 Transcript_15192/m.43097 type:complete len:220 (-) Transcript_15192:39-698(-)